MRMSIGQALGIKTAGDRLRAAERAAVRRGRKRGLAQGLEQGIEQGIEQGLEQGIEQGLEKGIEKGIEQERVRNDALNTKRVKFLRSQNVPDDVISAMLAIK